MCQICGKPNYIFCNCPKPLIGATPEPYCFEKLDINQFYYNFQNPAGKNGMKTLNLPNGTNLKIIIDTIDSLLGYRQNIPTPTPAPIIDVSVKVDATDIISGFLSDKISEGDNISFQILNPGANESIQINTINNQVSADNNSESNYLINVLTGGEDHNDILTLTVVDSQGTAVIVPSLSIAALLTAIENLPNYQNAFCTLVNTCFPPIPPPPPPPPAPCNPPTNLTVTISGGIATLNWIPSGNGQQVIQYKLNTQASYGTFATVASSINTITIPGLTENVTYNFSVYTSCIDGLISSSIVANAIDISCPALTVTSTTTSVTAQFPPLGGDVDSYLVLLLNSTGNVTLNSKLIGPPFTNPIVVPFTGLTPGTTYNVQVQSSAGTISNLGCSIMPISTTVLPSCIGPSNLQTVATGTQINVTWTADPTASLQNLYYGLTSGITGNPPGNGWTAYSSNPLSISTNSATLTGLVEGSTYTVGINSQCQNGNITPLLTSKATIPIIIVGSIVLQEGSGAGANQANVKLAFTFDQPTPVPLTLYIGKLEHNSITNSHFVGAGYSFFTLPSGYTGDSFYGPDPSVPFVVNVPVNSTTLTVTPIKQVNPGQSWQYGVNTPNVEQLTDIYITANSPSGVTINFTLTQSPNTETTVTIHNINT